MAKKRKSKRGDRRYIDPTGTTWASEFEYHVFRRYVDCGYSVRQCGEGDSVTYTSQVRGGGCLDCGSKEVVQHRIYTPDLYVVECGEGVGREEDTGRGYFVECKGYFPQSKRSLLRSVKISNPSIDLRIVFSSSTRVTPNRTNVQYACSMIKIPAAAMPKEGVPEWIFPR